MNEFKDKVIYNTKVKRYRDGSYTLTYCNRRVFVNQEEKEEFRKSLDLEETEKTEDTGNAKVTEIVNKFEASKLSEAQNQKRKEERTDSMKRAVDKIYDLAFQNEWDYFLTITIAPEQFDSKDVKEVYKRLRIWLTHQVSRKGLKYLLIPEHHENGGIHAHALINDCFKLEHSGRYLYSGKAYKAETLQKKGIDINLLKEAQRYNQSRS